MNTISPPISFEDAESDRLEHIESWQTVGIVTLGATGLALVLSGIGAMVFAVARSLGRLFV